MLCCAGSFGLFYWTKISFCGNLVPTKGIANWSLFVYMAARLLSYKHNEFGLLNKQAFLLRQGCQTSGLKMLSDYTIMYLIAYAINVLNCARYVFTIPRLTTLLQHRLGSSRVARTQVHKHGRPQNFFVPQENLRLKILLR